ncbi:MAG: hypothetical protein RLZZ450_3995, partial [Pseudomonadota bacterium]
MSRFSRVLLCAHAVVLAASSLGCDAPNWDANAPEHEDAGEARPGRDAGCA